MVNNMKPHTLTLPTYFHPLKLISLRFAFRVRDDVPISASLVYVCLGVFGNLCQTDKWIEIHRICRERG
jgi:hypothetical protein